jgi:putative mRNA 3-end processing factor
VGRSCIEVQTGGDRYLLDCGLKFHEAGFDYPAKVFEVRDIAGVFLSHAHLDHSGGLPFFHHYRMLCPIFCLPETKQITQILLNDSHKIARIKHLHEAFNNLELKETYKNLEHVSFNTPTQFRKVRHTFINAGHIPGSASIKLEAENLSILYTGDYNTRTTMLMQPADPHTWGKVDVLITECTYGARDLPDREPLVKEFLDMVERIVKGGGRVLIPVFAVGRAQEILIMLASRKWDVPIILDGMAKKVTHATVEGKNPYVINKDKLVDLMDHIELVTSDDHRSRAANKPGIFVTTSGMLQGGPAIHYLEHFWTDHKSAVLLTGYQVKGTNGWMLDNEGVAYIGGYRSRVQCEVKRFDFSGHLSREDIKATIRAVKPRILILNHGNTEGEDSIYAWAKQELSCEVFEPEVGQEIEIIDGKGTIMRAYEECVGTECIIEHQHAQARDDGHGDGHGGSHADDDQHSHHESEGDE